MAHCGLVALSGIGSLWPLVALSVRPIMASWLIVAFVLCGLSCPFGKSLPCLLCLLWQCGPLGHGFCVPQCGFKLLYLCVVYQCLVPGHSLVSVWSLWSDSVWQRLTR